MAPRLVRRYNPSPRVCAKTPQGTPYFTKKHHCSLTKPPRNDKRLAVLQSDESGSGR